MNKKQERVVALTMLRALNTPAARETKVKRMRLRAVFITMFFVMFGGLAGLSVLTAPSASADDQTAPSASTSVAQKSSSTPSVTTETEYDEECVTEENKTTCTHGSASASSTAQSSAIADIRIKGRIAGEFFVKGGLTKKQIKGKKCRWISGGHNSARRADGTPFSYRDKRRQFVCKTGRGPTGFQVVKCGNPYAPPGWPPTFVIVRNPVVVESLNKYKLTGVAKVKSDSEAHSVSETIATCVGNTGYGYGEASADANAFARIRFTFRHRSSFRGALRNAIIRHNESINVAGFAKVATKASTTAKSDASCTDQVTPPPPPPTDRPPVINIYGAPAHLFVGGNAALWIEASDPDNDTLQVSVRAAGQGDTCEPGANCVTGLIPVDVRWDGTPCPAGVKCYRATAWAGDTPGTFTVIATVRANGESAEDRISFPVVADEF